MTYLEILRHLLIKCINKCHNRQLRFNYVIKIILIQNSCQILCAKEKKIKEKHITYLRNPFEVNSLKCTSKQWTTTHEELG